MTRRSAFPLFLYATLIEGIISLIWLFQIPGDAKGAWVFGLSKSRFALLALGFAGIFLIIFLIQSAHRNRQWYKSLRQKIEKLYQNNKYLVSISIISIIGLIAGSHTIFSALTTTDAYLQGYLQRIAPLTFWFAAICTNILIYSFILHMDKIKEFLNIHRSEFPYLLIVLLISVLVYKVTNNSIAHWDELTNAAYGIIDGTPHWRAFSNRLLGPYTVFSISHLGFSFETSLQIFNFLLICIQNFVLFYLVLRYTENSYSKSIRYLIVFSFMLISVEDFISYTWDYIDTIIFTFFAFGIFQSKPTRYFVVLFLVELLNREIALFIAFFIIIDAVILDRSKNKLYPLISFSSIKTKQLFTGLAIGLFGIIYTKIIRDWLFIESTVPGVGKDLSNKLIGNHIQIMENINLLFVENFSSLEIVNSIIIVGIILYLALLYPHFTMSHFKAFIITAIMLLSILIFGLINETRLYRILIPFLLFFHLELGRHTLFQKNKNIPQ